MKNLKLTFALGILVALSFAQARATVIVTYAQDPGQETSTLVNSTMDTFNSDSVGLHTAAGNSALTWTGVGTFTNLNIKAADQYGGADNTNYAVVGLGVNTKSILNLNTPSSYFGLWWSAGDAKNVLDFYSGANGTGTLLAEFTTANLMAKLTPKTLYPNGYYGNPNPGANYQKDSGEPFAFINFFGTSGTDWSSIVITNKGTSGFEADNYTSRVAAYDPATDGAMPGILLEAINGTQVTPLGGGAGGGIALAPEPSTMVGLAALTMFSFGGDMLRRVRRPTA